MTALEDRLRDAFRADAETISPRALRGLPAAVTGDRKAAARPRSRGRILVPLAAAASVAAVALGSALVVPRVLAGQHPGQHDRSDRSGGLAAGYPGGRMPGTAPPRYFVAIVPHPTRTNGDAGAMVVVNATTGKITAPIAPPAPGQDAEAVAALGGGQTFVAAMTGRRCDTWFYRFRLTASGRPTALTPLSVPEVAGRLEIAPDPDAGPLAASANGRVVAYSAASCARVQAGRFRGQVGVIDVARAAVTTWPFKYPASPGSLSLSADGSLLAMVSNPSTGTRFATDGFNAVWLLRTDSAAGPLADHYRRAFGARWPKVANRFPEYAVLSPNGRVVVAVSTRYSTADRKWLADVLAAYRTGDGRRIRVLARFDGVTQGPAVTADPSGRYLLGYFLADRVWRIDLATGRITTLPAAVPELIDAGW